MADDDYVDEEDNDGDETSDGDTQVLATVEETAALNSRLTAAEDLNAKLSKAVTDPDVQAVIDGKAKGQSIRLTVGNETQTPEAVQPSDIEFAEMSNAQMAEYMTKQLGTVVATAITAATAAQDKRLESLEGVNSTAKVVKVQGEVKDLIAEFPDLPEHKAEIIELVTKSGLTPKEAYIITRQRKGLGMPVPITASERGSGVTVRSSEFDRQPARMGGRGFSEDLAQGMTEVKGW